MNKIIEKRHYCKNGYEFSTQQIGDISHLIIFDHNLYPDKDSRSEDYWRHNGLMIPINNKEDLKSIGKLFKP